MPEPTRALTVDEAIAMLPDGDRIHTFLGTFGEDRDRADVLAAIRASEKRQATDGHMAAMGHRLLLFHEGRWICIGTREVSHV